jgi:photosystem II stability/assembly factor-like uncharacterized protein
LTALLHNRRIFIQEVLALSRSRSLILTVCVALLAPTVFAQPQGRWAPFGPGGGTPTGLAVDPRNPEIVYAAAGTLYRSADGGETWAALFGTGLKTVALDPANPAAIYVGGSVLARSLDGGRTWHTTLTSAIDVRSLAVVPGHPSTLLATSGAQLLRSANGGRTWSSRFVVGVAGRVAADPDVPGTAYYTDEGGLHKSTDAGKSWSFSGPAANGRLTPHGLLAVTHGALYVDIGGTIFRSTDGARSWRQTGHAPTDASLNEAFLVDPASPDTLYLAGFGGIFRSGDQGFTWTMLADGLPELPFRTALAFYALAADPSRPGLLYAGSYEHAVAKSLDGGDHWRIGVEPGLTEGLVALFKVHPLRPDTFYVGLADRGDRAFRSTDGGSTWEELAPEVTRDGMLDLGFDPGDPNTLYLANEQGLWKSRDGGGTWSRLDASSFSKVAVPAPGTLLAGRGCGLSRSTDDGKSWTQVLPCFIGEGQLGVSAVSLWIDPRDARSLYALMDASDGSSGHDRFLAGSTDGGATWTTLRSRLFNVAVAPGDFRVLYGVDLAGFALLRSTDGGESWQAVHAPLRYPYVFYALAVSATDSETLYVGGTPKQGLLRSRNGGVTLTPLGPPFDAAKRAPGALLTDRNHPGVVWAFSGGLFWGRFE